MCRACYQYSQRVLSCQQCTAAVGWLVILAATPASALLHDVHCCCWVILCQSLANIRTTAQEASIQQRLPRRCTCTNICVSLPVQLSLLARVGLHHALQALNSAYHSCRALRNPRYEQHTQQSSYPRCRKYAPNAKYAAAQLLSRGKTAVIHSLCHATANVQAYCRCTCLPGTAAAR
jgi:hypothetical protein